VRPASPDSVSKIKTAAAGEARPPNSRGQWGEPPSANSCALQRSDMDGGGKSSGVDPSPPRYPASARRQEALHCRGSEHPADFRRSHLPLLADWGLRVRAVAVHRTFGDELCGALVGMASSRSSSLYVAQPRRGPLCDRRVGQMHVSAISRIGPHMESGCSTTRPHSQPQSSQNSFARPARGWALGRDTVFGRSLWLRQVSEARSSQFQLPTRPVGGPLVFHAHFATISGEALRLAKRRRLVTDTGDADPVWMSVQAITGVPNHCS